MSLFQICSNEARAAGQTPSSNVGTASLDATWQSAGYRRQSIGLEKGLTLPGKSVRLFFVDGTSIGLVTAEVMNWTGHILVAPRSRLGDALNREECSKTGVYILSGEDPQRPSRSMIYIGEGDNVASRLRAHARDETKEFWTHACIITSKDANLTKAHVRYLEHELVKLARAADRAMVTNGNDPGAKQLPEADRADMEFFIDQLETVLPAIGFDILRQKRPDIAADTDEYDAKNLKTELVALNLSHRSGIRAQAIENDGEIVVLKGSQVQIPGKYSGGDSYKTLRDQLIVDGVISGTANPNVMEFTKDHLFRSPSAAAAVIIGRNANGRRNWKLASGETLGEWQDKQLG